jgi:hypothetical protein
MQVDQSKQVSGTDGEVITLASGTGIGRTNAAHDETNAVPPSFEQWLDERLEDRHFGRYCARQLGEADRKLWDGPLPYEPLFPSFTSDDVLLLRAAGQVTTREEWEDIVEAMYRNQWQRDLATWAAYQSAPRQEQETLLYALLEAAELSMSVQGE